MPPIHISNKKFIYDKSPDWINGYIFAWLDTRFKQAIKNKDDEFDLIIQIPKSWFGLKSSMSESVTLSDEDIKSYLDELEAISAILCKKWCIQAAQIAPYEQYMELHAHFVRKIKRLTKHQIEQLLGYEIEIVED